MRIYCVNRGEPRTTGYMQSAPWASMSLHFFIHSFGRCRIYRGPCPCRHSWGNKGNRMQDSLYSPRNRILRWRLLNAMHYQCPQGKPLKECSDRDDGVATWSHRLLRQPWALLPLVLLTRSAASPPPPQHTHSRYSIERLQMWLGLFLGGWEVKRLEFGGHVGFEESFS